MDILYINPAHIIRIKYTISKEGEGSQVVMELSDGTKEIINFHTNSHNFQEFIDSFNFTRIK